MSTPDGWHLHRPRYAATPEAAALDSDLAQAAALLRAKDEHIRALEVSLMGLTAEVAALREALTRLADMNGQDHTHPWWTELNAAVEEARQALSQPFDLARFQERTAREWLTEKRLAAALASFFGIPSGPTTIEELLSRESLSYRGSLRDMATAILTALFSKET